MKLEVFEAFSARVDETLAFLPGEYTPPSSGGCWRCQEYRTLRPSGLCEGCGAFLLCETDVDPSVEREKRLAAQRADLEQTAMDEDLETLVNIWGWY